MTEQVDRAAKEPPMTVKFWGVEDAAQVEAVAKAIFDASTFWGTWDKQPEANKEVCVNMARAAIAALIEGASND